MVEITKISSKGQVVIPVKIREELNLEEGTRLVVSRADNLVVLKKINVEDALKEFDRLTKIGKEFAGKKEIKSEEDIVRIIHERRKKRRAEGGFRH